MKEGKLKKSFEKIIKVRNEIISQKNVENCDELYIKKYCKIERNVF